jgi:hypothetical protein
MNEQGMTLRHIFSGRSTTADRWKPVTDRIGQELKSVQWVASTPDLAQKVGDMLDIRISDVLVGAWKKIAEVKKYADPLKYPPDEVYEVELFEHEVSSEHKPRIEIRMDNPPVRKDLEFTVTVSLTLKAFKLRIKGGRVLKILAGTCQGKGSIAFLGQDLLKKSLEPVELPGSFDLGEGIPL